MSPPLITQTSLSSPLTSEPHYSFFLPHRTWLSPGRRSKSSGVILPSRCSTTPRHVTVRNVSLWLLKNGFWKRGIDRTLRSVCKELQTNAKLKNCKENEWMLNWKSCLFVCMLFMFFNFWLTYSFFLFLKEAKPPNTQQQRQGMAFFFFAVK